MTKDKFNSLSKYLNDLLNKQSSNSLPVKHTNREKEYKQFLANEISVVTVQLELAKIEGISK